MSAQMRLMPPLVPCSEEDVSSFAALVIHLRSQPELARENEKLLNAEALAQLTEGVRQFQHAHLGRQARAMQWPLVRIPDEIFRDRSRSGPLFTALLAAYREKNSSSWRTFDLTSTKRYDDSIDILRRMEKELTAAGFLRRPAIYFDETVPKERRQKLKETVEEFKGTVVTDPTKASHVVAFDPEIDKDENLEEEEKREAEGQDPEKLYLRTVTISDASTSAAGAGDDDAQASGKVAMVHWWYWPPSYDEWLPAADVSQVIEPETTRLPGHPWVVGYKFIRDVEKYNEWGLEADYAIPEYQTKVALYKSSQRQLVENKKKGSRASATNKQLAASAGVFAKRDRRSGTGMNPRSIVAGYDESGARVRRIVHDGALRVPTHALTLQQNSIEALLSTWPQKDRNELFKAFAQTRTHQLPGVETLVRPSMDTSKGTNLTVTELSASSTGTTVARNKSVALKKPKTERIRGGGENGISGNGEATKDVEMQDVPGASAPGPASVPVPVPTAPAPALAPAPSLMSAENSNPPKNEKAASVAESSPPAESANGDIAAIGNAANGNDVEMKDSPAQASAPSHTAQLTEPALTSIPTQNEASQTQATQITTPSESKTPSDEKPTETDQKSQQAGLPKPGDAEPSEVAGSEVDKTEEPSVPVSDTTPPTKNNALNESAMEEESRTASNPLEQVSATTTTETADSSGKAEDTSGAATAVKEESTAPLQTVPSNQATAAVTAAINSSPKVEEKKDEEGTSAPPNVPSAEVSKVPATKTSDLQNSNVPPTVVALSDSTRERAVSKLNPSSGGDASAKDEAEAPIDTPSWYDSEMVSDFEKSVLPEWFNNSASHRTESTYLNVREKMIEVASADPNKFITATAIRRCIVGDAGSLLRLHEFLTHWRLINRHTAGESTPTAPTIRYEHQAGGSRKRPVDDSFWTDSRKEYLAKLVVESSSKKRKADPDAMTDSTAEKKKAAGPASIDWGDIAEEVGGGVSGTECQRTFLSLPLTGSSNPSSSVLGRRAQREEILKDLIKDVRPEVVEAATKAALEATGDLVEAQKGALLGTIAAKAKERAVAEEESISGLLMELLDQRMQKMENRVALLDEVEGMLESERVALELERRDLYTARCRHWFSGGN